MSKTQRLLSGAAQAALAGAGALAFLCACTAGPDFSGPPPLASQHYDRQAEQQLIASGGDRAQRIGLARSIDGDWWSTFRSANLDEVMRKAVQGNFDLAAADAAIAQANEALVGAKGGRRPQLDVAAAGGWGRAASGNVVATSSFYAVGPQVSFDFDVFGGVKRRVEERAAFAELQRHRFDAAYLTLTGDIASQALVLASARAQMDAVQVLLADDRKNLELVRSAHQYGGATQVDVALAETQLAQDETLLPPLTQQRDVARHALSVLAGRGPADWTPPEFDLSDFTLPLDLPVSLPSEVAHDRPDILGAEAELHAASAEIGVATADLYPHLTLSSAFAQAGPGVGTVWSVVGALAGPIYHGGALQANKRAAMDGYQASLARYQQTVVRSLGQVADILQAINHHTAEYAAQKRALVSAEASLRLNQAGYRAGEIDLLQVLVAERAYQRALLEEIQVRTARYLDTVQLSIALGGNSRGASERRTASLGAR